MKKNKVVLFTADRYTSFVHTEIRMVEKFTHESTIVTTVNNTEKPLYQNTVVVNFNPPNKLLTKHLFGHLIELIGIWFKDLFSKGTSIAYLLNWKIHLSLLVKCSMVERQLFNQGVLSKDKIHYTYFFNDFALVLALAKERGHISGFYSRSHGRDVIEEREPITRKIPFQFYKLKSLNRMYSVSYHTRQYLSHKYPIFSQKFEVSYLGTESKRSIYHDHNVDDDIIVLSIGHVRNVKRFHLIADLLSNFKNKVQWMHVGNLNQQKTATLKLQKSIETLKPLEHVSMEFLGALTNNELYELLIRRKVTALINTSEFEGLPVSIQEAMSFGIPCIATDVGGTSEIVNSDTGYLLQKDFDPQKVAESVEHFIQTKCRDNTFRKGVRDFWKSNFQAEDNFQDFLSKLSHTA